MKFLFLGIGFLLTSCYSSERDCTRFHAGSFEFTQIINGELTSSIFTRDSIYEIEVYKGVIDTAKIRWVNDCECILTKLNPSSNQDKRPIQMKILNTKDNTYTFQYSLVGDSKNRHRGTIKKIK